MEVQKVDALDLLASAQNIRGNALCSVDCSSNQSFGWVAHLMFRGVWKSQLFPFTNLDDPWRKKTQKSTF